jgi:peroxiredoxin
MKGWENMNIGRLPGLHKAAILLLLSGLFLVAAHSAGLVRSGQSPQGSPTVSKLSDIPLKTVHGSTYSLSSLSQKRFILILGDNQQTWESQSNLLVDAVEDLEHLAIVVVLPDVPETDVLERYGNADVTFLVDAENSLADSMKISSFPRLLFISEDLSIAGNRRPIFGDHSEGLRKLLKEFSEGKQLSKSDLNLIRIGQTLPLFEHYPDQATVREEIGELPHKWLAVHFSAQCRYCVEELKSLKAMGQPRPHVVGITTSDQEEIEKLLADIGIEIPVIYDTDGSIFNAHDVSSLPTVFLVDQNGKILDKLVGYSEETFHRMVEDALTQ